jgi:phospholipid N-methyltransferase
MFRLRHIKTIGSVRPSSRYLIRKMLEKIDFVNAKVIVELGIGDGCVTLEILKRMRPDATLICFEIHQEFIDHVRQTIKDDRFVLIEDSAELLSKVLHDRGHSAADAVISSLPLAIIPMSVVRSILTQARDMLKPGGYYMQYQYSLKSFGVLKQLFRKVSRRYEVRNVPPAVIYACLP